MGAVIKAPRGYRRLDRNDRILQERRHDSYRSSGKLPEPTRCPDCGVEYRDGRWQWGSTEGPAHKERCPACHRIHDHFPAGFVAIAGEFLAAHRDEILNLVRNVEAREKDEHPLERIMDCKETGEGLMVTTTDPHLARGIGDALAHAYHGELEYHYKDSDQLLRVHWRR